MALETVLLATSIAATVGGTVMQMKGAAQQGRDEQALANARADIDQQNAIAVKRQADEQARILEERRLGLVASQKAAFAAGNVRLNVGAPLVIEAQTNRDVAMDKGFILETGRTQAGQYMSSAAYEKAYGEMRRKQSKWQMMQYGIQGLSTIGNLSYQSGVFSPKTTTPFMGNVASQSKSWLNQMPNWP